VVRGEIDNRVKGKITGKVWFVGRNEPVLLQLEGNGYRDVAGCLFAFVNPNPQIGDEHTDLYSRQVGTIGDYTASRKVRAFDIPIDEALAMIRRGEKPPEHWANCLYLEWFSERNGRVVIESYDYDMKIVDTAWTLDEQDEAEQLEKNAESMVGFMQRLGEAIEQSEEPLYDPEDDKPMDEFEWERFMKKADARTEKYGELLEKYMDHPDRDQIVAREMGWDRLADDLDAYNEAVEKGEIEAVEFNEEDFEKPVPNPLTEGTDWIIGSCGRPVHPLQELTTETVMNLWHECKDAGLLEESAANDDLHEMLFKGQCIGAKLAGALNGLAYDRSFEHAFIVACLKRALPYFDEMMIALEKVKAEELLASERLAVFSTDMFAIRAEIVQLIEHFRNGFDG
jgi:hypothetical protein